MRTVFKEGIIYYIILMRKFTSSMLYMSRL
jgi:hypothetical protein